MPAPLLAYAAATCVIPMRDYAMRHYGCFTPTCWRIDILGGGWRHAADDATRY